jgi:hypothetical protein
VTAVDAVGFSHPLQRRDPFPEPNPGRCNSKTDRFAAHETTASGEFVRSMCARWRVEIATGWYNVGIMNFEVIGEIGEVETFAVGSSIHELPRLRRIYGPGRWRKRKGTAQLRFEDGSISRAEVHWYEAHGIGRVEIKIKRFLDD